MTKCLGQSSSRLEQPEQTLGPRERDQFLSPEAGQCLALWSERATSCGDTENCFLLPLAWGFSLSAENRVSVY